ncbi:MAG: AMP-binding protein [Gammaproteobacteria bacterium]|nr:AMP-binding protein [Gammaproteobacteria bacterium]
MNELGIGRGDRLAIVLPNGPEMAACFVAVGCHATTAPLNPGYRPEEFAFYLSDLNATALIAEQGARSPAIAAARKLGIRIVELIADEAQPAGAVQLGSPDGAGPAPSGPTSWNAPACCASSAINSTILIPRFRAAAMAGDCASCSTTRAVAFRSDR